MTTDDNPEQDDPEAVPQAVSHPVDATQTGEARNTVTIRAEKDGYWADLEVEYTWSANGQLFTVKTLQFRARDNDRNEGNIKLGLVSGGDTGWDELTEWATQDGEWHSFVYTRSVAGNVNDAVIHFNFIYDRAGVSDVNMTGQARVEYFPATPSIDPVRNVTSRAVNVSGRGLVLIGGQVYVRTSISATPTLADANATSWSATVNLSANGRHMTTDAYQVVNGKQSPYSPSQDIYLAYISAPAANAVLVKGDKFKGYGAPGSKVTVVKADNQSFQLADQTTVTSADTWESELRVGLFSGPQAVVAIYELTGFPRVVSESVTYRVLGDPAITGPATNSLQERTFVISGINGLSGATLYIYRDLTEAVVGRTTLTADGNWSVEVNVPAGPVSLVAQQKLSSRSSGRSAYRAFKIKPPKLGRVAVTYPNPGIVRFSGAGEAGAKVDVHIVGNGTPQVSADVISGTWSVDWNDQPPASHQMDVRQRVSDGAGGWIYSDWGDRFTVTIPVPRPTLTVQVGTDRTPVFSGTGHGWEGQPAAQIEVRREGETELAAPVADVRGDIWSSMANEAWAPGTYSIQAWQVFNGLKSDPTDARSFIINAPLPTVEVREDGLTPHFSGTCLNNAEVTLWFDGETGVTHSATVTGTSWTFTREQPFAPGPHRVSVTQTVGGQTSNEASLTFDVVVLQPVITSPIDDEEVDHNPLISGTGGIAGATMRLFDFVTDALLGEVPVTGNEWSVRILADLDFGSHSVYAVQQYGDWPSERSERVTFKVILFPPTIDHPQPGDAMARQSRIDGYARKVSGLDVAWVELWLDGADEYLARVRSRGSDGYWFFDTHLPVGDYVLRARQFLAEEESVLGPEHAFTAVPAIPVIESPASQQHIGATVTMSGHGYVGDWVEVAWSDAPDTLLGRTQVQANRTWSLALPIDRPAGEQQWVVQQECDGYRSGWSAAHPVLLLSAAPTFTAPEAGQWFAGLPLFEGTGETGKTIELSHWFDTRQPVGQGDMVVGGLWTASPDTPLRPGAHWVKARQDDSGWGESPRFDVAEESPDRSPQG